MKKQVRYELLREAKAIKFIDTEFVAKAIIRSLVKAPAISVNSSSFIPPWWNFYEEDDVVLAWGETKTYPGGGEQTVYFVERRRTEPWYVLRAIMRDTDDLPVHSDYVLVGSSLSLSEALSRRDELQKAWGNKGWFFDIYPQDL